MSSCFECSSPADHAHHVVPQVCGGTKTVDLCERCHGLVHERGMTGHRKLTVLGLQRRRSEGKRVSGSVPYGFRLDTDHQTLILDEYEQSIILRIKELAKFNLSLRAIAETLDYEGLKSRTGKTLHPTTVSRVLEREEKV